MYYEGEDAGTAGVGSGHGVAGGGAGDLCPGAGPPLSVREDGGQGYCHLPQLSQARRDSAGQLWSRVLIIQRGEE